ncbi:MAG: peptidyl-prolyl cis-trans isomerase [Bacteroidales bacterium]|jgi:hypothetical protein|nr:peptidyl-prolyl cis-trans isomerase [Bacteroidales bacterium]MBR4116422.1 peptidyl-prolyl cis-trans isomerase [Bacteroidales bacterium]MCR4800004.1 peptidyl-prolyl cis-trans isomerase [Bacteroidales bacterium]
MMKKHWLIVLLLTVVAFSCRTEQADEREVIAKTKTQVLYKDDVLDALPISLSPEDSITFVKSFVENWLHFTLLYEVADNNVSDNDSSLAKRVDLFRKELYINAYEQMFLQQKLDTLIPQKEIDEYYELHKNEYLLEHSVVKPIFIVFPLTKEREIAEVEKLFFPKKEIDLDALKDFCFQHCQKFSFANQWVDLNALKQELPFEVRNEAFPVGKSLKFEDTANVFFVKIEEQRGAGNRMPIELAHDKIAKTILQSRKVEMLKNMREKVFQDATRKKQYEVFY